MTPSRPLLNHRRGIENCRGEPSRRGWRCCSRMSVRDRRGIDGEGSVLIRFRGEINEFSEESVKNYPV